MYVYANTIGRYDERHRFWTEQALNQFGNASNFFFLISAGFLAYLLEQHQSTTAFIVDFSFSFSWSIFFFALAILFSVLSLLASAMTVLSRLHDLRLTRHIIWIRKKSYDNHGIKFGDDHIDIDQVHFGKLLVNMIATIVKDDHFIKDNEISNASITEKFLSLRKRNLLIARFSWKSMNLQITMLIISLLLFLISHIL